MIRAKPRNIYRKPRSIRSGNCDKSRCTQRDLVTTRERHDATEWGADPTSRSIRSTNRDTSRCTQRANATTRQRTAADGQGLAPELAESVRSGGPEHPRPLGARCVRVAARLAPTDFTARRFQQHGGPNLRENVRASLHLSPEPGEPFIGSGAAYLAPGNPWRGGEAIAFGLDLGACAGRGRAGRRRHALGCP
jgi:hypothetical protein